MNVRFDEAWAGAKKVAGAVSRQGISVVALRDMIGRVSLIIDDRTAQVDQDTLDAIREKLVLVVGNFASSSPILRANELFQPEQILSDPELIIVDDGNERRGRVGTLERGVVGGEWARVRSEPASRRVTLYGFKGGVGRSTATFLLARRLAELGRSVLVVDLDLESPGIGPLLQSEAEFPAFGLVDYIVEEAVGNHDDLELVVRSNQVRSIGNGEVWIAPARGASHPEYTYLSKLNRVYTELPSDIDSKGCTSFAQRLESAVIACESQVEKRSRTPDVVLLDSRAGIHDVAAVALTQLSDMSLLFASDNVQTWTGYRDLFTQWGASGAAALIRDRLRMVASMVPSAGTDEYLQRFRDHAQACFAETLYEDASADDVDAYNPAPDDEGAPHFPLPISFVGELVGLDAAAGDSWHESDLVRAAFREFLDRSVELLIEGDDD